MKYLLDTCVISELIAKQPNPNVIAWIDKLDPDGTYLSVITIGEIRKGIEKLPDSTRRQRLVEWLHDELLTRFSGHILELDVAVMLTWGKLAGRLERSGRPIAAIDGLIAATALYHDCHLVTRNVSDFQYTDVPIINPWV